VEVHRLHGYRVRASLIIEPSVSGSWVGGRGFPRLSCVKIGVELDHVGRHVVCPFHHLGTDVHEERIRGPSSEEHNLIHRVVGHFE
jgi:hypothetical protein